MVVAERTWSSSGGAGTGFGSEGKKDTCCQPTPRRVPHTLPFFNTEHQRHFFCYSRRDRLISAAMAKCYVV